MRIDSGLRFSTPFMGYLFEVNVISASPKEVRYDIRQLNGKGATVVINMAGKNEYQQWSVFMASLVKYMTKTVASL